MDKIWYLKRLNLFDNLPQDQLKTVEKYSFLEECKKGTVIYDPNQSKGKIFVLKSGRVQLYKIDSSGRKIIYTILSPGEIFGELYEYQNLNSNEYAESIDDVTMCVMDKKVLDELINKNQTVQIKIHKLLGMRMYELEMLVEELAFKTVYQRMVSLLLRLHDKFSVRVKEKNGRLITKINISLSHNDLASMIGATREATTVALDKLKKEGIIDLARKTIFILDYDRLKELKN